MKCHNEYCLPVSIKELEEIRLIEIETRKVVKYPGSNCEYVALSYVWGDVTQDNYKLGDTLKTLSRTLEDALSFTEKLGKRYIWIDSVCIDQSNGTEKEHQIPLMAEIYAKASRVLVWLGEAQDDSDRALEAICITGTNSRDVLKIHQLEERAISALLQRPWFQRIWARQLSYTIFKRVTKYYSRFYKK
jgi:hypothetical protein